MSKKMTKAQYALLCEMSETADTAHLKALGREKFEMKDSGRDQRSLDAMRKAKWIEIVSTRFIHTTYRILPTGFAAMQAYEMRGVPKLKSYEMQFISDLYYRAEKAHTQMTVVDKYIYLLEDLTERGLIHRVEKRPGWFATELTKLGRKAYEKAVSK